VIEVERVLDTIRESYPPRRWSEALAAFLHDRDLLGQEWVREGVAASRRADRALNKVRRDGGQGLRAAGDASGGGSEGSSAAAYLLLTHLVTSPY
jgi:hypothetical protein